MKKLKNMDPNEIDLTEFFEVFREGISIFKHSGQSLPMANFHDCRVIKDTRKRKRGRIYFYFLNKKEQEVKITIDLKELAQDPAGYCEYLRHHINQAMSQAESFGRTIYLPTHREMRAVTH